MAMRTTRSSAAKEAAFLGSSSGDIAGQQLSSPPPTPSPARKTAPPTKKASKQTPKKKDKEKPSGLPTPPTDRKRKRVSAVKPEDDINELPHNLGRLCTTRETAKEKRAKRDAVDTKTETDKSPIFAKKSGRGKRANAASALQDPATVAAAQQLASTVNLPAELSSTGAKGKKTKANLYGLTPGETPYPDWPHPTPEECQEVTDLLSKVHGEVKSPATIPAPSATVSGCGEVPSILDALIRTLLSAATTGTNSSRAFKGLVDKFGLLQEGIGKGSVDWEKVRVADRKDVFEAIRSGGLAVVKSQRIKEILDLVYEENIARRDALVKSKSTGKASEPRGAANEDESQQQAEILRANQHVLSLDHLHALSSDEALNSLIKYPGIGPKTASCVLLFCMQRPSFAVDTHVFRLCKWLNWVPPNKASRNTTYSHCEVRVPNHLKYPLHQLLIRHGKTCPRCRAATGDTSQDWGKGCPIEHLVKRTGKRKSGFAGGSQKKTKRSKKFMESEEEETELEETEDNDDGEDEDDDE